MRPAVLLVLFAASSEVFSLRIFGWRRDGLHVQKVYPTRDNPGGRDTTSALYGRGSLDSRGLSERPKRGDNSEGEEGSDSVTNGDKDKKDKDKSAWGWEPVECGMRKEKQNTRDPNRVVDRSEYYHGMALMDKFLQTLPRPYKQFNMVGLTGETAVFVCVNNSNGRRVSMDKIREAERLIDSACGENGTGLAVATGEGKGLRFGRTVKGDRVCRKDSVWIHWLEPRVYSEKELEEKIADLKAESESDRVAVEVEDETEDFEDEAWEDEGVFLGS